MTVSVHVPSVTRVEPEQVSAVSVEKSPGWSPEVVIKPIVRSVIPLFVIVSILLAGPKRGTFPKLKLLGFLEILGGFALALRRTMVKGFLGSLDDICNSAVFGL